MDSLFQRLSLRTWAQGSALAGGVVWLEILLGGEEGDFVRLEDPARLMLFAILVVTPLSLWLVAASNKQSAGYPFLRAALILQPLAAIVAAVSFALFPGRVAGLMTLPWLVVTLLAALAGVIRLVRERLWRADQVVISAGLLYFSVGGGWLVLSQLGMRPMEFGTLIVLLTAVHFHFISLGALVLTGLAGRKLSETRPGVWPIYRMAVGGVVIGPALVAAGITFSLVVEVIGAVILALSLIVVAGLALVLVVPRMAGAARVLLGVSWLSILGGMVLAGLYAVPRMMGGSVLTIQQMVQYHGWLNALGFSLMGLTAWCLLAEE